VRGGLLGAHESLRSVTLSLGKGRVSMLRRVVVAGVVGFIVSTAAPTFGSSGASLSQHPCRSKSGVVISRIRYNPPAHRGHGLNGERVVITNRSKQAKDLTGWSLRDSAGHVYRFQRTALRSGHSVTVHTGHGANKPDNRYWGRSRPAWKNTGDEARLRNRAGVRVDSCRWGHGDGSKTC
jgi:Lamin Tail Domain